MSLMDDLRTLARWVPATDAPNSAAAYERLRAFVEQQEPWYPPQQDGYGPWIEYKHGDAGPRIGEVVRVLTRAAREDRLNSPNEGTANGYIWGTGIVAYCVKLEDKET